MRFLLPLLLLACPFPALADQTDPGLDQLFADLAKGHQREASATVERIEELWAEAESPSVALIYDRAEQALAAGQTGLSEELAGHVTRLAPSFAQGFMLQGVIFEELGKTGKAAEAYRQCLELEPRHFFAAAALADIHFEAERYEAALKLYQQALKWNPHYPYVHGQIERIYRVRRGQAI